MQDYPEFPQPPPELPEGSTSLPPLDTWWGAEPQIRAPSQIQETLPPASFEYLEPQILQYTPEVQEVIRAYLPRVWGTPSTYTNVTILSLPALLEHIEAATKADAKLVKAERIRASVVKSDVDLKHSAAFAAWQSECQMRNAWIEEKAGEWRKRIAERTAAMSKWNEYVEAARIEYQSAKATTAPPRPIRD